MTEATGLGGAQAAEPADGPTVTMGRPSASSSLALAEAHREGVKALDLNPLLVLSEGRGVVALD